MEDFVTLEIAQKLKEKGFREKCLCYYNDDNIEYNYNSPIFNHEMYISHNSYDNIWHRDYIDAPTISQVLKWLREEKKYVIMICVTYEGNYYWVTRSLEKEIQKLAKDEYISYEQAALAGIEYVFNNLILML